MLGVPHRDAFGARESQKSVTPVGRRRPRQVAKVGGGVDRASGLSMYIRVC
jgi:hypothetical protein